MNSLTYVTSLPRVNVSDLTQLQWAVSQAETTYALAKENVTVAWKMFDDAVEDGNTQAKNESAELAQFCEFTKHEAWTRLNELKAQLLALMN